MTNSKLSPACTAVVARYVRRRGVPADKLDEFLNPTLHLGRFTLPDADGATLRLQTAVQNNETVVIFGDYDADGMISVSILLRFFQECTTLRPRWKLPHRKHDQYGLDLAMAQKIGAEFQPKL